MEYGIDLGTTQSCIACIDDAGRPVVVKSALGEETTPSAVFFESGDTVVVGRAAHDEALLVPDLVAQLVKRDMGTDTARTFHGKRHTPETVSALILRELARLAAAQTGQPADGVVITVPGCFGVAGREATRRAGELAGFETLDVLTEPVAAAIHYQAVSGPARTPKHVLVCDLGGGTFDTTVIRLDGDDITVVCTDGDDRLGGTDWDQAIAGYLLGRFTEAHPGLRPEQDQQFMRDLLISAERLKRELSAVSARRYTMRFGGRTAVVELTRSGVEDLTAGLLARTVAVLDRAVATARAAGVTRFDDVLLVGGMGRSPAVGRMLRQRLGAEVRSPEPELAVAKGAALFARSRRARPGGPAAAAPEVRRLAAARVAGVVPRGLGVQGPDKQIVTRLLPANTPLPAASGPYTFVTAIDSQRTAGIDVWEQAGPEESEDLAANRKVGEVMLRHLPPLPAGTRFEITFFMSETGSLTMHATESASGRDVESDLRIGGLDGARLDEARHSVASYQVKA